jgi:hypothetical protein
MVAVKSIARITHLVDFLDELTMQVLHDGVWHRRLLSRNETACGVPYHGQFHSLRRESLEGKLCGNCFTIREQAISDDLAEKARIEAEETPNDPQSYRRKRDTKIDP